MALFARLDKQIAEELLFEWPSHRWVQKSVKFLLSQGPNAEHIKNIPLNDKLLESVKKNGFESPFLVLHTWYPICGSQRLRVAQELGDAWCKKQKVWVCRFDNAPYKPLFYWPNKEEGHEATQRWFQMCEVVFKTLYMPSHDKDGVRMVDHEEYGNHMHWPNRDGKGGASSKPQAIGAQTLPNVQGIKAPPFQKKPMAQALKK